MSDDRDSAIVKVQKLFALGQGRQTEPEAQAALGRAQVLMLKYNITVKDLVAQVETKEEKFEERDLWTGKGKPWQLRYVILLLQGYFFVKPVFHTEGWRQVVSNVQGRRRIQHKPSGHKVTIFGTPTNLEIATQVFVFLNVTFRQLWEAHRKETKESHDSSRAFYKGVKDGFSERLDQERTAFSAKLEVDASVQYEGIQINAGTGAALIVRTQNKLDDAVKEHYGQRLVSMAKPKDEQGYEAYAAGVKQGRELELPEFRANAGKLDGTLGIEAR